MAKRYDAAGKEIITRRPEDWVAWITGRVPERVEVLDSDVSAVSGAADKVWRVYDPEPWVLHLELQSSNDVTLASRLLRYNVLIEDRHGGPAETTLVLLDRRADSPQITGVLQRLSRDGSVRLEFRYRVIRVWRLELRPLLTGTLGAMPLAVLTDEAAPDLAAVLRELNNRLENEVPAEVASGLWDATAVLAGLRYEWPDVEPVFRSIRDMRESSFYTAVLEEGFNKGRAEGEVTGAMREARQTLLELGSDRFGPPDAETQTALEAITEIARLRQLRRRLLHVSDWKSLLAQPEGSA